MHVRRGLGVGLGVVLALTALCPMSYADEVEATGQGAWLGVSTERLKDVWRERAGYWADGVMVVSVVPRSPADQVGIGPGDVLVRVGERTLRKPDDLAEVQATMEPGHPVSVVIARDGGRMIKILKVEPDQLPASGADPAPGSQPEGSSGVVRVEGGPPVPNPTPSEEIAPSAKTETQEAVAPTGDPAAKPESSPAATQRAGSRGLGLRCEDLNADLAAALGEPEGKGVLVIQVQSGSIADRSGIRPGDIITKVGDQAVENLGRLDPALAVTPSPISIVTLRQGVTREVVAELEVPAPVGNRDPAGRAVERHSDAWRDQVMLELRDEVRKLRDEVQRLRTELEESKRY